MTTVTRIIIMYYELEQRLLQGWKTQPAGAECSNERSKIEHTPRRVARGGGARAAAPERKLDVNLVP